MFVYRFFSFFVSILLLFVTYFSVHEFSYVRYYKKKNVTVFSVCIIYVTGYSNLCLCSVLQEEKKNLFQFFFLSFMYYISYSFPFLFVTLLVYVFIKRRFGLCSFLDFGTFVSICKYLLFLYSLNGDLDSARFWTLELLFLYSNIVTV